MTDAQREEYEQKLKFMKANRKITFAEGNPVTVDFTTVYDWRTRNRSFESMSLYRPWDNALTEGGEPELINGLRVSYNFFDTLGVKLESINVPPEVTAAFNTPAVHS